FRRRPRPATLHPRCERRGGSFRRSLLLLRTRSRRRLSDCTPRGPAGRGTGRGAAGMGRLRRATQGLPQTERLAPVKDGAILLDIARGTLVDEEGLLADRWRRLLAVGSGFRRVLTEGEACHAS